MSFADGGITDPMFAPVLDLRRPIYLAGKSRCTKRCTGQMGACCRTSWSSNNGGTLMCGHEYADADKAVKAHVQRLGLSERMLALSRPLPLAWEVGNGRGRALRLY